MRLPIVGISLGDPCGIGPEVTARALTSFRIRKALIPVVFGDAGALEAFGSLSRFERTTHPLSFRPQRPTLVEVSSLQRADRRPGHPTAASGRAQFDYVMAAIEAAKAGRVDALCTAPVSKEQISRAGIPFMGHTEVLAEAFGRDVLMMMDGPRLRVALATNHLPIARVPEALSIAKLLGQIRLLSRSLRPLLRRKPRLVVCGLNPHAGEGGLLGREEVDVIAPAVARAREEGISVTGPHPADGLFAGASRRKLPFDAALVMFHDQGLVLAKALDFELTVNVTLGLPIPRSSPDHGVAYDIAGKGKASAEPMIAALLKAAALV